MIIKSIAVLVILLLIVLLIISCIVDEKRIKKAIKELKVGDVCRWECQKETPFDEPYISDVVISEIRGDKNKLYVKFTHADNSRSIIDGRSFIKQYKKIGNNPQLQYAYKKKGSYYYRENNKGYTENLSEAGIYTLEDALQTEISTHEEVKAIPIDIVQYNDRLRKEINILKSKLIN